MSDRQTMGAVEPTDRPEILRFFRYAHLPRDLQDVSAPFGEMAYRIVTTLPDNREREKALDRLLESKDAAVRAMVAK